MTAAVVEGQLLPPGAELPGEAELTPLIAALWPQARPAECRAHVRTLVRVLGVPDSSVTGKLQVVLTPEPAVDPNTRIEVGVGGDRFLVPWDAKQDRRPKSKTPRWLDPAVLTANCRLGAAKHGECTPCVQRDQAREAIYRMVSARGTTVVGGMCAKCARTAIGGPLQVPTFSSPEEAQAWLDAQE